MILRLRSHVSASPAVSMLVSAKRGCVRVTGRGEEEGEEGQEGEEEGEEGEEEEGVCSFLFHVGFL